MAFYLINLLINILIGFAFLKMKKRKTYLVLTALQLILISGLRGINIGTDTKSYFYIYENAVEAKSLTELANQRTELFYLIICKISFKLNGGYQLVLFITSTIIISGFMILIYRFSENVVFSVFLFFTLGFYQETFNGVRHFIAAIFILNSLKYIEKKQIFRYLLMFFIAFFFHRTSALLLPLYLIRYVKWNKKTIKSFFIFIIILFISLYLIAEIVVKILPVYKDYLQGRYFQPNRGLLRLLGYGPICIFVLVVMMCKISKKKEITFNINMCFSIVMLVFACLILSYRIQIVIDRFGLYFSPFFIIAIPSILKVIDNKSIRKHMTSAVVIASIFQYIVFLYIGWQDSVPYYMFLN